MKRDFSLLEGRKFDLLICGGGIYGAWAAYDAALRGLKVAIIEQGDWAHATSSASSKLIHGGLRYLETLDFKLVNKALAERRMLLATAPHRVWPLRFGVPVYANSRIGTLQLKAGLTLYDFLAGSLYSAIGHRRFNRTAFTRHFPSLDTSCLKGGFTYADAQTDDARLVLELIAGALTTGAVCVNYCKLTELLEADGRVYGANVRDQVSGNNGKIIARQIVFATGQWATVSKPGSGWCRLTKGVHLVMPAALDDEALLLTAQSDGRVFFMIPWYGRTLVGTTDTDYQEDIGHVAVTAGDKAYLLAAANHYLKTPWTEADIIGSYAGLRVMKRSDKTPPSSVNRDWELKTADNGVHYSVGGKITSAREDAARIIDTVCAQLGINAACATKGKMFPWAPEEDFTAWCAVSLAQATQLGIDPESAKWLVRRHGKRIDGIFLLIKHDRSLAERIISSLPFIWADLLYCAKTEMAMHLDDILRRRLPLFILAKLTESELIKIATPIAKFLAWDESKLRSEISACQKWLTH